jgi:hypothetical protein
VREAGASKQGGAAAGRASGASDFPLCARVCDFGGGHGGRKMFHVKHLCDLFAVKFFSPGATMR